MWTSGVLLPLGIAFIGVITVLEGAAAQMISLAVLVLLATFVVTVRMRGRLSHDVRIPGGGDQVASLAHGPDPGTDRR